MRKILAIIFLISFGASAQEAKQKKIKYEYKKFERFDFDEIGVEGEAGSPGDISVTPTPRKEYGNKLPERKNFFKEMKKSAGGIR